MATKKGFNYYTKEEIDEMFAVEDVDFTLSREGLSSTYETQVAGKRIRLGGNVYAYVCKARATGGGFSPTSTGDKNYYITFPEPFSVLYGGAANGAFVGQANCHLEHCQIMTDIIDIWIYSASTSSSDPLISFVAVGEIDL